MSLEQIKADYQDSLSRADRLRDAIVVQLHELLDVNDITLGVPIESRVKTWPSIEEKLQRKQLQIEKVNELEDLVGVRLIVLFKDDLSRAISLISENLEIVSSEDTATRLGVSEFGYQSQHFVIRLPKEWLRVPSLASLKDFYVELQVRTLAQHIWAAASHKLQYKNEESVPPPLRRTINRVSALLETVDLEFDRILQERRTYIEKTRTSPATNEPLNVDNLASVLDELLPPENKSSEEQYALLLENMNELGVHTSEQLRFIINRQLGSVMGADKSRVAKIQSGIDPLSDDPDAQARATKQVFFTHVGLIREALRNEYGSKIVDDVMKKRKSG